MAGLCYESVWFFLIVFEYDITEEAESTLSLYLKVVLNPGDLRLLLKWPELASSVVTVDSGEMMSLKGLVESMLEKKKKSNNNL